MKIALVAISITILMSFPENGQILKDGDIITLKSMGKTDNPQDNKVWLSMHSPSGTVKLLPEDSGTAALWLVRNGNGKDVFRFMNLSFDEVYGVNSPELGYRSTRWLSGNPKDGIVRGNEEPTNSWIQWKVTVVPNTSESQIMLENLGQPSTSLKWLNSFVNTGVPFLTDKTEGIPNTRWQFTKRVFKDGLTLARKGDPGVWLLENGCRRLFPSDTVYQDWVNKHGQTHSVVEQIVLESLPKCDDMQVVIPPDGTLIAQTGGRPGIWRIEGGKKRLFPDYCTFQKMGGGAVKEVDDFVFNRIPDGANFPASPECPSATPSKSIVCPSGPGIIITFMSGSSKYGGASVRSKNSNTGKESYKYLGSANVLEYAVALQETATAAGIISQREGASIRVCGRDHIFTIEGCPLEDCLVTRQF